MIPSMKIMKTTSLYIETDSDVLFGKQGNRHNIHIYKHDSFKEYVQILPKYVMIPRFY